MCSTETPTPSQPSTTPNSSQSSGGATQPCHPTCTLASQTIATSPANRARTKIGVGEEVTLTITGNPATWTIAGGGTLAPSSGTTNSVRFTAAENAESVTITATGSGCGCSNTIIFNVVRPSNWTMIRKAGTNLKHTHGRPDCGWQGVVNVHPNDVNFYRVETREKDSQAVTTGSYTVFNGVWHGNYALPDQVSGWIPLTTHTDANGSAFGSGVWDNIYSGDPGAAKTRAAPPFIVGTMYFDIVWQWRVVGSATIVDFPTVRQDHEIFTVGKCRSRKAGNSEESKYDDLTSTP